MRKVKTIFGEHEVVEQDRETLTLERNSEGFWFMVCTNPQSGARHSQCAGQDEAEARRRWAERLTAPRCVECGEIDIGNWEPKTTERLKRLGVCFGCDHWLRLVPGASLEHTVIVGGFHYRIGKESPSMHHASKGHGGALFSIRFLDGREVQTTNLWAQGEIPPHFRDRLSDNAVFERKAQRSPYVGSGSATV